MLYGAKNAMWAPISKDDASNALPTYGETISFNGINEVADSISLADGTAYGDNVKKIVVKEFAGGTITVKLVELSAEDSAAILGVTTDGDGGLSFEDEHDAPYGGYGFINNIRTTAALAYKVIFYPKVQASADTGTTYKTKEDNITLEYESLSFEMFQAAYGAYKLTKVFDTEAAAVSYLSGLFAGTSTAPGLEAAAG